MNDQFHDTISINNDPNTNKSEQMVSTLATYLDEHRPGWAAEIDLDTLNLNSAYFCVFGQTFANQQNGEEDYTLLRLSPFQYGFEVLGLYATDPEVIPGVDFNVLASNAFLSYWKEEISKRQLTISR